jgi:tRNA (guanine26-N2/guanine27-N2)-dimethyltransferase
MDTFKEGKISFIAKDEQTRSAKVFFNPDRKFDRDLNVLLFRSLCLKGLSGADLFSASGIRGLRLSAETDSFRSMLLNDLHTSDVIKKNVKANMKKLNSEVTVSSFNVTDIDRSNGLFDYIDIDPFGSPMFYAVHAMENIRVGGVMALTATDTAALYGSANKACAVRYRAVSAKTSYYNELGLRILLKRMDDIAGVYRKEIEPIFFDVRKHYVRAYVRIKRIKPSDSIGYIYQCGRCPNRALEDIGKCGNCGSSMIKLGPVWSGKLFDRKLVQKMYETSDDTEEKDYLDVLRAEGDSVTYYTTTELASYLKQHEKKSGVIGTRTVLNNKGFRTDLGFKELLERYKCL